MSNNLDETNNSDITYYLILIGIVGTFIRLFDSFASISWNFLHIPIIMDPFIWDFIYLGTILMAIGYIGLTKLKDKSILPIVGLFIIAIIFSLLIRFGGIGTTWEFRIIRNLLMALPLLILYTFHFSEQKITALLFFIYLFLKIPLDLTYIFMSSVVRPEIATNYPDVLSAFNDAITSILLILVIVNVLFRLGTLYWLGNNISKSKGFDQSTQPVLKTSIHPIDKTTPRIATGEGGKHPTHTTALQQIHPIDVPILGRRFGVPIFKFWCRNCNNEIKMNNKNWKKEEYETPHPCPRCNDTLLGFYVQPDLNKYKNFLIGLIIFAGGITTSVVEGNMGTYGVLPAIILFGLAIIQIIVGSYIIYSGTRIPLNGPPAYASETVTMLPSNIFINEVIIIVAVSFAGGIAIWIANGIILSILM